MSFIGVLFASALIYLNSEVFNLRSDQGFSLIAVFSLCVMLAFTFQFFDYVTRFVSSILSKLHFRTQFIGQENIPECPALYVCTHTAWNDTLLILGAQRRRIRFFIENEQKHSSIWMKRLYKLLRVVFIPDIEPLDKNQACLTTIQNHLNKGISVCIFIESWDIYAEVEKLHQAAPFNQILEAANYPIIPVRLEKGVRSPRFPIFKRLLMRLHVPASVAFGNIVYSGHESTLAIPHEHDLYLKKC